ncbi:MAG: BolA family protein [Paracoccaceae bacterium]
MTMAERMTDKLRAAFAPDRLALRDDSERHRGHGGWREGGETHFHLVMVSRAFEGQGRVARQRAVNAVLRDELAERVHALSMELRTPAEADGG